MREDQWGRVGGRRSTIKLYTDALAEVQKAHLPIHLEEIVLTPLANLITLVKKSMQLAAADAEEEQ